MNARPFLLIVGLATLLAMGCQPSAERRITGSWELDVEATATQITGGESANPLQGAMQGMMEATLRSMQMRVVFQKDKHVILETTVGERRSEMAGTWRVIESGDDSITIGATLDSPQNPGEQQLSIRFLDGDRIEMTPPAQASLNQTVVFKRS